VIGRDGHVQVERHADQELHDEDDWRRRSAAPQHADAPRGLSDRGRGSWHRLDSVTGNPGERLSASLGALGASAGSRASRLSTLCS
jgi:hypothetical protein